MTASSIKSILLIAFNVFLCLPALLAQGQDVEVLEKAYKKSRGSTLITKAFELSDIYMNQGETEKALEVLDRAAREARKSGSKTVIATVHTNIAKTIISSEKALKNHFYKALSAIEVSMDTDTEALYQENLELLYQLKNLKKSLATRKKIAAMISKLEQDHAAYLDRMEEARIEAEYENFKNQGKEAFVAVKTESEQLKQAKDKLSELNKKREQQINTMTEEQMRIRLQLLDKEKRNDSLRQVMALDSLEAIQLKSELALGKARTKLGLALLGIVLLVSLFLLSSWLLARKHNTQLSQKNKIIEVEKQKSEDLLLNILPSSIADELKEKGSVETKYYDQCSVLFLDFVNFSEISKALSPQALIEDLHFCFSEFDKIVRQHKVEKIKTIGDAYMCATGVPGFMKNHADTLVKAGLHMQAFLKDWNRERKAKGLPAFNARIGIHSGPVIGGVVGSSKFVFDLWGDTVNTASRMENTCAPGKVNISCTTRALLTEEYNLENRGKIKIKNMDDMEAYFVTP